MIISERVRGRMVVSDLTSLAFFSVSRVQGEGRWAAQEEPVSSISCRLHIVVVQRSLHVAIALINLYGWLPWKYIVAIGTDYFVAINIALFSGPTQLSVTCLSIVQKEGRLWREEGGGGYWEWGLSLQLPSHSSLHTVAGIWFVLPVVSKVRVWCLSCTQEFALLLYWLYLLPPILISQWFSAGWMWQEILGPGVSVGPLWDGLPPCAGECWPITLASFRGPLEKP